MVASSGFPEGDKALYRLSRPSPVCFAICVIPLARAISPKAAAINAGSFSSSAMTKLLLTCPWIPGQARNDNSEGYGMAKEECLFIYVVHYNFVKSDMS